MHIRMQDNSNVEINNPMYLREEYDDGAEGEDATFNMNPDKVNLRQIFDLTNENNPIFIFFFFPSSQTFRIRFTIRCLKTKPSEAVVPAEAACPAAKRRRDCCSTTT